MRVEEVVADRIAQHDRTAGRNVGEQRIDMPEAVGFTSTQPGRAIEKSAGVGDQTARYEYQRHIDRDIPFDVGDKKIRAPPARTLAFRMGGRRNIDQIGRKELRLRRDHTHKGQAQKSCHQPFSNHSNLPW